MLRSIHRHWRRFAPHRRQKGNHPHRDTHKDQQFLVTAQTVDYVCQSTDFFDCAEERVVALLQRRPEVHDLEREIGRLQKKSSESQQALDAMTALIAQGPRTVLAQLQMDQYPHGYHNKQQRLYELIDFNDTIVATILALDDAHRKVFDERAKQALDRVCRRVGAPCFSNEQWEAIMRGLSREVAVYLAARDHGFHAWMTDRVQDAMGIDLQVQDPEDQRYINIDVKSPSSFRRRMEQLVHEDRLSERELLQGDERHYIVEYNGHGAHKVPVVVLCVLPDVFGEVRQWRFVDPAPIAATLNQLIRDHGLYDRRFGRYS